VPLTIVGGFLGSGKTSLLNHILTNATDRRIAVLVNDFGEINIDAKLIVSVEGETISLANGCVCCTIRDDLLAEVLKLLAWDSPPEHIVIETSGVSRPVAVAETFSNPAVQGLVELQTLVSVLDADLVVDERAQYGDLAFDQIERADLVVINKTDLVAPQRLARLRERVEAIVPRARLWETSFGVVPLELIFDDQLSRALDGVREGRPDQHNHHGLFRTWTYRSDEAWSFNALQRAVDGLPSDIYRAKGIVRLDLETGDYGIFQLAGRRSWLRLRELETATPEETKTELVFIGKPGAITDAGLRTHLDSALAAARTPAGDGYIINDLRAFEVIFV
jgi:G3E family GTPase